MPNDRRRTLGLGIDTGGTFTDAVIIDMATMEILAKAKSPTTYEDLTVGLLGAVDGVIASGRFSVEEIEMVGLSTTLATNSLLTGKGGKVGLICIGWFPGDSVDMGTSIIEHVEGGHSVNGSELNELDMTRLDKAIMSMLDRVDAITVSSIFSVYNPSHEERARKAILERTDKLVVTGHDLTTQLGIRERTITAVLNAQLIPIIGDFLTSVEASLKRRKITGQTFVFKGDGSLMNLAVARERPVETILSGPVASLMGGKLLSKQDHCIVIDIGGTSTDIAYLDNGFMRINREGALVGNWRTMVRAIDIWTSGLGGDSNIKVDCFGGIEIGPEKVIPLSMASRLHGSILDKLQATRQTTYFMAYERASGKLTPEDSKVYDFIRKNVISTHDELCEALPMLPIRDNLGSLRFKGFLMETGLTPTDILHFRGIYTPGDVVAAKEGVEIFSNLSGLSTKEFVDKFMDEMVTRIGSEIIKKVISDESGDIVPSKSLDYLIKASLSGTGLRTVSINAKLDRPIIGLGGMAYAFVPALEKRMGVKVIIPPNSDVGNAVGAVCSKVTETISLQVYPRENRFWVMSPFADPLEFFDRVTAVNMAKQMASKHVKEKAILAGANNVDVLVNINEDWIGSKSPTVKVMTNWTEVRAMATGYPILL